MTVQVSPEVNTPILQAAAQRAEFLQHLRQLAQAIPSRIAALEPLRDRALGQLQEQAFPTSRDEEWRFNDLSALLSLKLTTAAANPVVRLDDLEAFFMPETASRRLVFVNGVYSENLSALGDLPSGVTVANLAGLDAAWTERLQPYLAQQPNAEELFTTLNTAGLSDVAVVFVPKNTEAAEPIRLLFVSTAADPPTFSQPRVLVVAEANSSITLLEDYLAIADGADSSYFANPVTEIWLGENASVNHTRLQRDSRTAVHIGKTAVSLKRSARYTCNALSLGAALSRHHLEVHPTGEQAEVTLNGLTVATGDQESDLHSAIALSRPYCTTRQLQKNIVGDRAHVIFNGKVFVPQAAQLTDAGQLNRNLLLSSKARIDTKPQLEIVADNVKCTHGATVSQLEADEVFYLQSRGIDAASAQRLLIYAFAYEILEKIPIASLRESLASSSLLRPNS
ncbi:Fe-S cluster assembly protein SufD [Thermoleptolyngbya sp. C42_A2020_037]|uniref:Fe-S cluster assembly protein SufD n=1 Tax=Thermoleptolyngbya sp. C42_A2020_037 TaxID=2747799 RepID=UPI0019F2ED9E|nr:Fe-S cluster assembly protein SufD [Thermoleptolyngbya sp. C42_A2020_037]MBF2086583.1 Fe-S cluster assembly protein SufD [Thermoleptolyngbya sp. C42_A2020_037]